MAICDQFISLLALPHKQYFAIRSRWTRVFQNKNIQSLIRIRIYVQHYLVEYLALFWHLDIPNHRPLTSVCTKNPSRSNGFFGFIFTPSINLSRISENKLLYIFYYKAQVTIDQLLLNHIRNITLLFHTNIHLISPWWFSAQRSGTVAENTTRAFMSSSQVVLQKYWQRQWC